MRHVQVGLLAVILMGVTAASYSDSSIQFATVSYHTVFRERVFDAYIEAKQQTTASAQTGGRVAEVRFDVGEFVPKGSVIVRFRDKEQRAAYEAAQARLEHAKAKFTEAESEYIRIKEVHAKKLVSKAALDKASAAIKSSKANLNEAEARLKTATEGLERTVVRAPYSGVVVKRHIEVGESARVGDPLITGLSLQKLRAITTVPQSILNEVLTRKQVKIIVPTKNDFVVKSSRMVLVPCGQPVCTAYTVRVDLVEGVEDVFPGMLVKAVFVIGEEKQLLIPKKSLVYRSELIGVYVKSENGDIQLRQVRVGKVQDNDLVAILSGLDEGELVITDPIKAAAYIKANQAGNAL